MQKDILIQQIEALKERIAALFVERSFFGLEPRINETPSCESLDSLTLFELDEYFYLCMEYYEVLVRDLRIDKSLSAIYQRSLGMNGILQAMCIGVSNFNVYDLDKACVEQMYVVCTERLLQTEQQVLTQYQTRNNMMGKAGESFQTCQQVLDKLNDLVKEIQRLESLKGVQVSLPILEISLEV